jgi:hypothetical protein
MYNKIIDEIESIRSKNNVNWMDLVRLAFEVAPDRAKEIIAKIVEKDKEVCDLTKRLLD